MRPEIQIRPLASVEEFEACVEMQSAVWGFADRDLVPRRVFVVADKIGGQSLGAWDGPRMAGFTLAIPGLREGRPYWHSHMLAVGAEYRNLGLGRRLKLRQREEALGRGIELMEWTFDPLEIKNGYFNITVLGATARRYQPDLYGMTSSALQAGLPTDRLTAEWRLRSPRVAQLGEGTAAPEEAAERRIEVPAGIQAWKEAGDPRAAERQRLNREAFLSAFAAGLEVVGYRREEEGGAFLLGKGSRA